MSKELERSFVNDAKEPIIERIFKLVERYGSRAEAAAAWGININTLQNYYKRREQAPVPREMLLRQIAEREGVSVRWLVSGEGEAPKKNTKNTVFERKNSSLNDIDLKLLALFGTLSSDEKQALFEVLARKGIETALYLLDEDNIKLLKMDRVVKEKILGIQHRTPEDMDHDDAEARECGADNPGEALPQSLASNKKVG
ncbi:hypothetical protein [Candidatus Symbiopectobacterium sp.]|uniref:hypothetical protein n=1 Tax=Candidatus Symbiopectobacterium sp. TaxID=2816440 RepID=UPI0025BD5BB7|nr:hypothetical protein [Candidatus Symbiopectobacterium sp.]